MARVIDAMRYENCLVRSGDIRPYRYLACTLQLYESTVMIGMVCSRIMREYPECPLWPIHDCVMTTQPYGKYVLRVLQELGCWRSSVRRIRARWTGFCARSGGSEAGLR